MQQELLLPDETATAALGRALAGPLSSQALKLDRALCVFLEGDLGAGKTTLTRSLIHALGYEGVVKSPTYTLVEPYALQPVPVYHFDLYRLADPEELEFIGGRDYFREAALCMVEWPDKGGGVLPEADVRIVISHLDHGRMVSISTSSLDLPPIRI